MSKQHFSGAVRKIIGEKIRSSREDSKLSLRDLAVITGMGHSWLAKLEKGQINFQIDSLTRLLEVFEIQPKELFEFTLPFSDDSFLK
jgi:transcriptional regulator with XRE-family HTH domain